MKEKTSNLLERIRQWFSTLCRNAALLWNGTLRNSHQIWRGISCGALALCLLFFVLFVTKSPSAPKDTSSTPDKVVTENVENDADNDSEEEKTPVRTITENELYAALAAQELKIVDSSYVVQDSEHKTLYPDILQVILQNDTSHDIKNAVIGFVAWDKNNLPVKIKGSIDFSDGAYIYTVNYNDINLVPGSQFGNGYGFQVDEECGITSFKGIVISYEAFDGTTWENPYYDEWRGMFEGVKYTPDLTVEGVIEEATVPQLPADPPTTTTNASVIDSEESKAQLQAAIDAQEVRVTGTKYVVQDAQHKTLYPDMLQAVIQNDSQYDIKNAVVAFVAWDKNNLPVKIKGAIDFSDGAYISHVNYNDINLVPGASYGSNSGYEIDEDCGIDSFKAIVVSYETFDGTTWENPLYFKWSLTYEGKKQ